MLITKEWLEEKEACDSGVEWFLQQSETDPIKVLLKLKSENKYDWFYWLVAKLMNKNKAVQWAIYSAELVLPIFEEKYPDDDRPRKAIEAAKAYLNNPCAETIRVAADAAADAAYVAAVYAACADRAAACAAADAAACAAADAAYATDAACTARAADAAVYVARAAVYVARAAAYVAAKNIKHKIMNKALEILEV